MIIILYKIQNKLSQYRYKLNVEIYLENTDILEPQKLK